MIYRSINNYSYSYKKSKMFLTILFAMLFLSLVYLIVTKTYSADVSWSTYDGVHYRFTNSSKQGGTLIIGKSDSIETFTNRSSRMVSSYGWFLGEGNNISAIRVEGTVNGTGTMAGMFGYYTNAVTIDLTNFNTTNVTDMNSMFIYCQSLRILKLGPNFQFKSTNVGLSGTWQRDGDSTTYSAADLVANYNGSTMSGTWRRTDLVPYAMVYSNGELVFQLGNTVDSSKGTLQASYSNFETTQMANASSVPWNSYRASITKVTFNKSIAPISTAYWFYNLSSLTTITNLWRLDTSNVTNMSNMFYSCSSLTSLDAKSFDTNSVTLMGNMFTNCSGLTSLNVANFDTSNVTNMMSMFSGCSSLTSLDLSSFDTSNVNLMTGMFSGCTSLQTLDISNFTIAETQGMQLSLQLRDMFKDLNSLRVLKLSPNFVFKESNCPTNLTGSWKRDGDQTTYTAADLTANYDGSTMSGTYRNTDQVYAILYSSGRLVFQLGNTPTSGYGTVTATYSGFETTNYSSSSTIPWNSNRSSITTVMFNTEIAPISTAYWFYNCSNLTTISNITRLITDSTTNMNSMFRLCSRLTSLNITSFKTSNVTNMSYMFSGCSSLTSISINTTNFNTSNVTNMNYMFSGCSKLEGLNLSGFNTTNVSSMTGMLSNTTALNSLSLGSNFSFITTNIGLTGDWKKNNTGVVYSAADLVSNYNGSTMSGGYTKIPYVAILYNDGELVFQYGEDIDRAYTEIYRGVDYKTYNSPSAVPWHNYADEIKEVTFKDELKPQSLAYWFADCVNLKKVNNIENLDTSAVSYMMYMFYNCSSLKEIDISSFDYTYVSTTDYMFAGCSSLEKINMTGLSVNTYATSYPTMGYMFYNCSNLKVLDLDIYTINVTDKSEMLGGTTSLRVINLGENLTQGFYGLTGNWKRDGDNTVYTGHDLANNYLANLAGVYRKQDDGNNTDLVVTKAVLYSNGEMVFQVGRELDPSKGNPISTFYNFEEDVYTAASQVPWYSYRESITKITFRDEIVPASTAYWFQDLTNLKEFDGKKLNTSFVTTMTSMFRNCSRIESLDLSSFDTRRTEQMRFMFNGCTSLSSVDLSSFNTSSVTSGLAMVSMFNNTTSLRILKLGTNFEFKNSTGLAGNWKRDGDNTTYSAEDLEDYYDGSSMAGIYRNLSSQVYVIVYSNGEMVFQLGPALDSTRGTVLGIYNNVENNDYSNSNIPWYSNKLSIRKVIFTTYVEPMSTANWFNGLRNLTEIVNIDELNTSNVDNMKDMFNECHSLKSIDLSHFNTSKVYNMNEMFKDCYTLSGLDVSSFDTSNVENMGDMFSGSYNLENLDVSNFDTSSVLSMSGMFSDCMALTSLDLSNFDTSKVQLMNEMFINCENLKELNISSFDTSNVEDMSDMFSSCMSLEKLDISNFDMYKSSGYTTNMFYDMTSLRMLKLGENCCFDGSEGLTGNWRKVSETTSIPASTLLTSYYGSTMAGAWINVDIDVYVMIYSSGEMVFQLGDTPDPDKGLLLDSYSSFEEWNNSASPPAWTTYSNTITTVIFDTDIAPKSMSYWFADFSDLSSIVNLDKLDTSGVRDMFSTFYNCQSLTNLDLSSFDTSNVIDMRYMFADCLNLNYLDISSFDSTTMINNASPPDWMFRNTPALRVLKLGPKFDFITNSAELNGYWQRDGDSNVYDAYTLMNIYDGSTMSGTYRNVNIDDIYAIEYYSGEMVFQIGSTPDNSKGAVRNYHYVDESSTDLPTWMGYPTITSITFETVVSPVSTKYWFAELSNLVSINNLDYLKTSDVTDMRGMFINDASLEALDLEGFVINPGTDVTGMFYGTEALKALILGNDTNFRSNKTALPGHWQDITDIYKIYDGQELTLVYNKIMPDTYVRVVKLTVKELVKGNQADINKYFNFGLTLSRGQTFYTGDLATTDGTLTADQNNSYNFRLKHKETVDIYIPFDIDYTYTVTQDNGVYTLEINGSTIGTSTHDETLEFIDTLSGIVPTGLLNKNISAYLILLIITSIIILMIIIHKKKKNRNLQ